jgi:hypothetical protein
MQQCLKSAGTATAMDQHAIFFDAKSAEWIDTKLTILSAQAGYSHLVEARANPGNSHRCKAFTPLMRDERNSINQWDCSKIQ